MSQGAGEMVHWISYLSHRHEDCSLGLRTYINAIPVSWPVYNPVLRGKEKGTLKQTGWPDYVILL